MGKYYSSEYKRATDAIFTMEILHNKEKEGEFELGRELFYFGAWEIKKEAISHNVYGGHRGRLLARSKPITLAQLISFKEGIERKIKDAERRISKGDTKK